MTIALANPRGPFGTSGERHIVLFYEDEATLCDAVVEYIAAALAANEPALVIATPEHRDAFRERLSPTLDVERVVASGLLTMIDAQQTLDAFMVGGAADQDRFNQVVGAALAGARSRHPVARLHVYGEMVDILAREGHAEVAIRLEQFWEEIATHHSFSLLCAYAMDALHHDNATVFSRVYDSHTHIHSLAEMRGRLRMIADLQRRARILEADLERRKESDAFRLLVESVQDYAIFMLDPGGFVRTWNAGAERLKGYRSTEIIGQHFSHFYPTEDIASGKCERELATATAEGRFEEEGWRVRKDGTLFWASVVITALRDPTGSLVGFAKVTRDLTERRKAEEERLRLAKYQEASRTRDEFIATVSHELRTPLNAILGWAMMLTSDANDRQTAKAVSIIVRNAQAQARLIDDLLDVSRIITGKLRLELGPVNLETTVRDALEVVRPAAEAKDVTLRFERLVVVSPLIGDAPRLQQVAWNLLSNAVKFTETGGSVTVRLDQEGSSMRLRVRDTGRGIDPTFLPHVFDRFRQAEASPTRRVSGLGLGLSIVRHIVELHGGRVSAESEGVGKGATFTITLPVRALTAEDEAVASENPALAEHADTRLDGIAVLVVDDEADARELLVAMLEKRGANVESARSPRDARLRLESVHPDVVVCDVGMPGEDGYQFVRTLRQQPRDRGGELPVIALTGYASAQDRRRAFDAGFNNHVPKPVHPEELASAIRNLAAFARS